MHHSFPPFNLTALADLHGGTDNLLAFLRKVVPGGSGYEVGGMGRGEEIHEMRELRAMGLGQYGHNNQPMHHFPYLFAALGDYRTTAKLVRQILLRAYSPAGFAGDEDNGEISAWYILSSLGMYSIAPGTTEDYILGAAPLFPKVHLHDLNITVEAPSAAKKSTSGE